MSSSALRTWGSGREFELRRIDQLILISQHRQHQRVLDDLDGGKVLSLSNDDLGDPDPTGVFQRVAQQGVRVMRSFLRRQVVGRLEVPIVDLFALDEVEDVDRAVFGERGGLQVFFGKNDEPPFLVLEAFDEVLPCDGLAFTLAHALVPHRRFVPRVKHPKLRPVIAHGCMQFDGDGDQTERDRAFPD